jgi:hypothetical protein
MISVPRQHIRVLEGAGFHEGGEHEIFWQLGIWLLLHKAGTVQQGAQWSASLVKGFSLMARFNH